MKKGKQTGSGLTMRGAVNEAICFGWIDSRTKRLDETRYLIRFTPRKNSANWSSRNLERARELFDQGRMTEAGISKLPPDSTTLEVRSIMSRTGGSGHRRISRLL